MQCANKKICSKQETTGHADVLLSASSVATSRMTRNAVGRSRIMSAPALLGLVKCARKKLRYLSGQGRHEILRSSVETALLL